MNQRTVLPGARFGAHRVIAPSGVLPQPAERLDARFEVVWDNEIIVDVETLNVDAASFRQIEEEGGGTDAGIVEVVRKTVIARGKQHNPVTNSGGMLLGTVEWVGAAVARDRAPTVGDRVRPPRFTHFDPSPDRRVPRRPPRQRSARRPRKGRHRRRGSFRASPGRSAERLSLAVLDVAGAGIQISRRAKAGQTVVILGAGEIRHPVRGGGPEAGRADGEGARARGPRAVRGRPPRAGDLRRGALAERP